MSFINVFLAWAFNKSCLSYLHYWLVIGCRIAVPYRKRAFLWIMDVRLWSIVEVRCIHRVATCACGWDLEHFLSFVKVKMDAVLVHVRYWKLKLRNILLNGLSQIFLEICVSLYVTWVVIWPAELHLDGCTIALRWWCLFASDGEKVHIAWLNKLILVALI